MFIRRGSAIFNEVGEGQPRSAGLGNGFVMFAEFLRSRVSAVSRQHSSIKLSPLGRRHSFVWGLERCMKLHEGSHDTHIDE